MKHGKGVGNRLRVSYKAELLGLTLSAWSTVTRACLLYIGISALFIYSRHLVFILITYISANILGSFQWPDWRNRNIPILVNQMAWLAWIKLAEKDPWVPNVDRHKREVTRRK